MFATKEFAIPSVNMLGSVTTLKGDIWIDGDFRIDGKLFGNIKCTGKITIGTTGYIEGQLECKDAEISGVVKGSIKAIGLITLKESSTFTGDITTSKIMVESGSKISITCVTDVSEVSEVK